MEAGGESQADEFEPVDPFDTGRDGESDGGEVAAGDGGREQEARGDARAVEPPSLIRASDLLDEEAEPAELGFEPGNLYRGQQIMDTREAQDPAHTYLFDEATAPLGVVRSFYVQSKDGTYGLVPWAGSTIIWPHEQAWTQDLYHAQMAPEKVAQRKAFIDAYAKKQKEKK